MSIQADDDVGHDDIVYPSALPFALVHVGCLPAIWTGVTMQAAIICVALYTLRMIAVCASYHRYFSHRAFATSRVFQFILAFLAQTTTQKSVLWWAAVHRHHHLYSDTKHDAHSPRHSGFFYSHLGWMFNRRFDKPDLTKVSDLTRYPELVWLHKYEQTPAIVLALLCLLIGGWPGLVVGFFWSTVLVYHATFSINSLAHVHGKKRYVTGDDSRNNWLLALVTMGEGWHNNHHAYQSSVRQGFKWWEIDATYYVLKLLSSLGVVWDLKMPPETVLRNEQRLGAKVINRAAEQLAGRFHPDTIALAISAALHGPQLAALREKLKEAQQHTADAWTHFHMPHLPTREQFQAEAKAMFARSRSLDEIADRAYRLLLVAVDKRLAGAT
jgi:stearoyl-CoA desaturase (delta-9 desaturase)